MFISIIMIIIINIIIMMMIIIIPLCQAKKKKKKRVNRTWPFFSDPPSLAVMPSNLHLILECYACVRKTASV